MRRPLNLVRDELLWLCAAALILTKTAKLIARADFVMLDLLSGTVLVVER